MAQVGDLDYAVWKVADRLGISIKLLYTWKAQLSMPTKVLLDEAALSSELRQTRKELARVTEERNILKKGNRLLVTRVPVKHAFIRIHRVRFSMRAMCRVLKVHFSGFLFVA